MHDSWCYLVISCFGQILYDETPTIRYRQHSNNTIGAATSNWDNFVRRLKRLRFNKKEVFRFSDQAAKFLTLFESMIPQSNKILIKQIVAAKTSFSVRICLALSSKIWRQSILDNAILRVLILLNKF